jgi:hypothetical protein
MWTSPLALAALSVCLFAACSSTTLRGSWKDEQYTGGPLSKLLVIGVAQNTQNQRNFEDEFVKRLEERGTAALASYRIFGAEARLEREVVENKVRDSDISAVLVTKLVGSKIETVHHPATTSVNRSGGWHGYYSGSWDVTHRPASTEQYEVLSLESNLFDSQTSKLIWSASFETVVERTPQELIKSFVDVALKSLVEEQLVR